jgi:CorA-like Mg2+ transporter protein
MLGIILVDPPFSPNPEEGTCEISEYRPFSGRPKSFNDAGHRFPRESLRNSFQFCLSQDPSLFRASVEDPFILVRDLLKIMASEWIVVLKYIERELVTIETCLEKHNPSLYDLEAQLTDLFIIRRRAERYRDLIVETRCWCASQGQESWPRSAGNDAPLSIALDLVEDYKAVERMVERNCERIDRNEKLLTAEVAVAEGKRNASKSDSMAKLTILATIFLPFSTIASVLNMNGSFAPGQKDFWIFWAIAIPINAAIFFVYAVLEVMQRCKRDGLHGVGMLLAARMKLGKSVPSSRNS